MVEQNRRLYLAGAIGNGNTAKPKQTYKNVRFAEDYYGYAITHGWTPFCPHLSYHANLHFEYDIPWERWLSLDLDYIDSVAALVRLPNESIGADMEVDYAKSKGIPVLFVKSPEDMIKQLEETLGKPQTRDELEKYISVIKKFRKNHK